MKLCFIDCETTGTDKRRHGLVQIAGILVIDGWVREEFDIKIRPFQADAIDDEALKINGITRQQLEDTADIERLNPQIAYSHFISILQKYVDKYSRQDKFFFIGYNGNFDADFIREFFLKCSDKYFGSWFFWPILDVATLAGFHLMKDRWRMPDFTMSTVALHMGINIEGGYLHDAVHDIRLTKAIFEQCCTPDAKNFKRDDAT